VLPNIAVTGKERKSSLDGQFPSKLVGIYHG